MNSLYQEQQQWFQNMKNQQIEIEASEESEDEYIDELIQLMEMGFTKPRKNIKALIQTAGNLEQAVGLLSKEGRGEKREKLEKRQKKEKKENLENKEKKEKKEKEKKEKEKKEKKEKKQKKPKEVVDWQQVILGTKSLILDCYNMKFSSQQWNQFHGNPLMQVQMTIELLLYLGRREGSILADAYLIWDVLHMKNLLKLNEYQQEYMQDMASQLKFVQGQHSYAFKIRIDEYRILNLTIATSKPQIADDYIVDMCQGKENNQTVVVTSDRGLRDRLRELGVKIFIGSGKYWRMKELMNNNNEQQQQ